MQERMRSLQVAIDPDICLAEAMPMSIGAKNLRKGDFFQTKNMAKNSKMK